MNTVTGCTLREYNEDLIFFAYTACDGRRISAETTTFNSSCFTDQTVNELEDVDVVKVKIFFHKNPKFVPFLMPPSIAGRSFSNDTLSIAMNRLAYGASRHRYPGWE